MICFCLCKKKLWVSKNILPLLCEIIVMTSQGPCNNNNSCFHFYRLSVTGCGPEWDWSDREWPAAHQSSQAGGGEPGQETAGAGDGDPGKTFQTQFFVFFFLHLTSLWFIAYSCDQEESLVILGLSNHISFCLWFNLLNGFAWINVDWKVGLIL